MSKRGKVRLLKHVRHTSKLRRRDLSRVGRPTGQVKKWEQRELAVHSPFSGELLAIFVRVVTTGRRRLFSCSGRGEIYTRAIAAGVTKRSCMVM